MKTAVRSGGKWIVVGAVAAALAGSAFGASAAQEHGPYMCARCPLAIPVADFETNLLLESLFPDWGDRWLFSGDVYIICNESACAHYRITDTGDFYGDKIVDREVVEPTSTPA